MMPIETTIETMPGLLRRPEGSASAFPLVGVAEDAGFEPARALTQHAFQVCPPPFSQCPEHTPRRRSHAWQPIMNAAERSRMRLKLRLAPRLRWHEQAL